MKYLNEHPSNIKPIESKVNEYKKIIKDRYKINKKNYQGRKMAYAVVDEKIIYLDGPFSSKSRLINKINLDMKDIKNLHEPSLRRAIKDWIDENTIIIKESFKNTEEEILEFFIEYKDDDPDNFKIEDVLIFKNKRVVSATPYVKNTKDYKKGKLVTVMVDKPDGLESSYGGNFSNSIEKLRDIIADIERFYDMSGEEVNYKITTDYMGTKIQFVVIGGELTEDYSKSKKIDELFKELKELYKKRKFRPIIRGNWFELKTRSKRNQSRYGDYSVDLRQYLNRIVNGEINLDNVHNDSQRELVQWFNKVTENGLTLDLLGGDHQLVIKLKKI